MFTDTHCHISKHYYDNIDDVLMRAVRNGVNRFFICGAEVEDINEVLSLINEHDNIYGELGYHPSECEKVDDIVSMLKDKLKHKKVIALGEIGLDYHYEGYDRELQIAFFRKQMDLAKELNLPVIIHSRDATKDTINVLKDYNLKGIIHSFSGSLETANIYIKMGYLIGINGVVTFKNNKLKDYLREIDINHIVLETDSPYLSPDRGKINEPANIMEIAKCVSSIYGISTSELSEITNNNIKRIFDI